MRRIYLDNNATTGLDPCVAQAIQSELSAIPSNPASAHWFGRQAKERLDKARKEIADFLGVDAEEIYFTSGGTEGMNLLIHGLYHEGAHLISSNVEHASVYEMLLHLQQKGMDISFLPAGLSGAVSPEQIRQAIRPNTRGIVLTAVGSETGVKHDLEAIATIALHAGVPLIVDGVGLLGKELFSIHPGIAGMAFSGHKIHAPKGIGCIFASKQHQWDPLFLGGGQERGLRSGTHNLPGIVGLAKAVALLRTELPAATQQMAMLRDHLEQGLIHRAEPVIVNGRAPRVCNTCNLSFPGILGEDLLIALDMAGIAVSHGSACHSGALEPSRILRSMGIPEETVRSSIRFSLSRMTSMEEIDAAIETIATITYHLRKMRCSSTRCE